MKAKFKKGQLVRIVGNVAKIYRLDEIEEIKEVQQDQGGRAVRYIIPVNGSDRYFYQDELEGIKEGISTSNAPL